MPSVIPLYSTSLSGKAGLLDETLTTLRLVANGSDLEAVRAAIVKGDVLGKATHKNRLSVWEKIHERYLTNWPQAVLLAKMVMASPDRNSARLLIYYEFCCSEPILYDAIIGPVFGRFSGGFTGVEISDLQTWLDSVEADHLEIRRWSPQTRKKVLSNILTVLRDFGLMAGTARKVFQPVYLPLPVFGYVLYRLHDVPQLPGPRGVISAPDWRLFFQDEEDVIALLNEAAAAGYCTFKRQGDVMTLDLRWSTREAYVAAIAGQVQ
ncbi:MAG TPA: BrxA family protein [Anaerolineae bacterium]|nr:BrxA family protein [Anaerolineae bacterium]